jgi:hypothetical protein
MRHKAFFLVFLYCISTLHLFAQREEVLISHYLFPSFVKGKVILKTGIIKMTNINYNSVTEEMIFDSNGTKLALANIEAVDTIDILGRLFVPEGKVFYEVLLNLPVPLYARHLCRITLPGNQSGFGGTSETSAIKSTSTLYVSGSIYEMKLPTDYRIAPYSEFLLKKGNVYYKVYNVNQLIKCFPEKKAVIRKYVKTHKTDFRKTNDLKSLVVFCNE